MSASRRHSSTMGLFGTFYVKVKSVGNNIGGNKRMRKTKIICTLGPSTDEEFILKEMMLSGMDVARLNMSHQTREIQKLRIEKVKKLREEVDLPIAVLIDTKGPEIRIGKFQTPKVQLVEGQIFNLYTEEKFGDETGVSISAKELQKDIYPGVRILIDDGLIELNVKEYDDEKIVCEVLNAGVLSANKSINIPQIRLSLPFLGQNDIEDIRFAVEQKVDFIAASFTRSADDIRLLKEELRKNKGEFIKIIAKIENIDGVNNIDEILSVSDGIMVARGDLGVEVPIEEIPIIQKELIKRANKLGKHVIIATQMLDSMINNPRPTRAEATDVANAIYEGASAIMLSGETASGKYPIQALRTMSKIATRIEFDIDYAQQFFEKNNIANSSVTSAISHATCSTAHDLGVKTIITATKSGRTAEALSKYRPACKIIAGTTNETTLRQMNLLWGVCPILMKNKNSTDKIFKHVVEAAQKHGHVLTGDLVVLTLGIPFGVSGTTNLLKVHLVGNILVSGTGINQGQVCANLCVCNNEDDIKNQFKSGDILVIPDVSRNIINILEEASGVIIENDIAESLIHELKILSNKPIIIGAKNATTLLKNGTAVTLDADKGIVFSDEEVCIIK